MFELILDFMRSITASIIAAVIYDYINKKRR